MSSFSEKYGSCVRIPTAMLQRTEELQRVLVSPSGGVPSRAEAMRMVYEAGLKSLESGNVKAEKPAV
jgi:hypothetical protein